MLVLRSLIKRQNAPNGLLPYCHRFRRPALSSLFVTKWGSRICRDRFDLESRNLTGAFKSVGYTNTPDMTSPYTSRWKISTLEKGPKMAPPTASTSNRIWCIGYCVELMLCRNSRKCIAATYRNQSSVNASAKGLIFTIEFIFSLTFTLPIVQIIMLFWPTMSFRNMCSLFL